MAAFIPEGEHVGFFERPETYCWRKMDRYYCQEMYGALTEEAEVPHEERERRSKEGLSTEQLADYEEHHWRYMDKIPRYELGSKTYKDVGHLWTAWKDLCRCDDPHNCPTWRKMRKEQLKERKDGLNLPGLHLFEVKSDKDNYTRLVHQLPSMFGLADYAWLVLGEKQEIPAWLPPWIGVLRFTEKKKRFDLEVRAKLIHKLPVMYRHVLGPHDTAQSLQPYIVKALWRKWTINSLFWFQTQQIVLDMTNELKALGQVSKWVKTQGIDLNTVQKSLVEFVGEDDDEVRV
jgi:hypothetical protein